eukprot:TRINITY_DN989_c0_g2_i2.p1 TRINITY_DN989_c0_g2~~TRINITY_DN989_c0_g2_i2.p1  ORF type:complete len:131 (-),score=36.07 TRINITY_DN989_c0_g2_i2:155-502(-)
MCIRDSSQRVQTLSTRLTQLEESRLKQGAESSNRTNNLNEFQRRALGFLDSVRQELTKLYKEFLNVYMLFTEVPVEKLPEPSRDRVQQLMRFEKRLNDSILQFQEFIETLQESLI